MLDLEIPLKLPVCNDCGSRQSRLHKKSGIRECSDCGGISFRYFKKNGVNPIPKERIN